MQSRAEIQNCCLARFGRRKKEDAPLYGRTSIIPWCRWAVRLRCSANRSPQWHPTYRDVGPAPRGSEIDTRSPSCVEKLHEEQMTIALCERAVQSEDRNRNISVAPCSMVGIATKCGAGERARSRDLRRSDQSGKVKCQCSCWGDAGSRAHDAAAEWHL